ncbi:pantoate--beta-alanine ligase [Candidatus Pelagibacter ubique]|nr:pantoate--beta-alanine ligase [Candidatus Pelagibacter ubique]
MFYLLILILQMKLIRQITDLNKAISSQRELGFVPTMGSLHKGHASLINSSKQKCKKTLVSIFVNPTQFNDNNDFKTYPRNLNKDIKLLKSLKVDFLYVPTVSQIYNNKKHKITRLNKSEKILCAKFRKGHFEGVLNVMGRFTDIIKPKNIFMGEKDYQQFFLARNFIERKYKTKVIACKTVRDVNKVALSSRNSLLDLESFKKAGKISLELIKLKNLIKKNIKDKKLIKKIKDDLIKKFKIKIEYLECRNTIDLKTNLKNKPFKIFVAYYLKNVRLIDNF